MLLKNHPFSTRLIFAPNITKEKKYYLYIHFRHDKQEAFYVGIGTKFRETDYDRALCCKKRSDFWKKVANKTTYSVMIIDESDDRQTIIDKEINYIRLLGKKKDKNGTLVNITDGGEGMLGHRIIWTEEMRKATSERLRNRVMKDSTREKHRENIKNRSFYGKSAQYVSKPILKIDAISGEVLEEFLNCVEASKKYNVLPQSIRSAIVNNFISVGFRWKFKDKNKQRIVDEKLNSRVKKGRKYNPGPKSRIVFAEDITTHEFKSYPSARAVGREFNIHHGKIKDACNKNMIISNTKFYYGE